METEMKYEVKVKELQSHTYGIWNNDMQSWQYVEAFKGNETFNLDKAHAECQKLNFSNSIREQKYLTQVTKETFDACFQEGILKVIDMYGDRIMLNLEATRHLRNFLNQLDLGEK